MAAHAKEIDAYSKSLEQANSEKDEEIESLSERLDEADMERLMSEARIQQLKAEKDRALEVIASIPPDIRAELEKRIKRYKKER